MTWRAVAARHVGGRIVCVNVMNGVMGVKCVEVSGDNA